MAESVTDPLEKAVLSGALFAGPDPEGREPRRAGSPSTSEELSLTDDEDRGFVPPSEGDLEPGPSRKSNGARHRTGPKGVLADYREQQEEKRVEQEHRLNKGMDRLYVEDDHDDEEEREALEAYRRQRIAEMKKMGSAERHQANDFASTGDDNTSIAFGHLREVGQAGFLKAIEETPASVTVVIHVYDPSIPACQVLNHHLTSLARSYPYTLFLRAPADELDFAAGNEEDVLPTLLVYKGGDIVANLVAVDRHWVSRSSGSDAEVKGSYSTRSSSHAEGITREMVEKTLLDNGIVNKATRMEGGTYGGAGRHRTRSEDDDVDDDE